MRPVMMSAPTIHDVRLDDAQDAQTGRIVDECQARIVGARHLSEAERVNANGLLEKLKADGVVNVPDNEQGRKAAVGGVQWAMEACLRGTEFIVTPERPTPLRTHGEMQRAHGQAEREAGLIERVKRGDPLRLVFCRGGVGTPMQDATFRREVLAQLADYGTLQEHYLAYSKDTFPAERSGAFIISSQDEAALTFAIRAAQIDKVTNDRVITLYLGVSRPDSGRPLDTAIKDWKSFLEGERIQVD